MLSGYPFCAELFASPPTSSAEPGLMRSGKLRASIGVACHGSLGSAEPAWSAQNSPGKSTVPGLFENFITPWIDSELRASTRLGDKIDAGLRPTSGVAV